MKNQDKNRYFLLSQQKSTTDFDKMPYWFDEARVYGVWHMQPVQFSGKLEFPVSFLTTHYLCTAKKERS